MTLQDMALITAGAIGAGVAPIHGLLVRRFMTNPIKPMIRTARSFSTPTVRLIPLLLDFSAFNWFLSGVALIASGIWFGPEAKMMAGLLAGSSFLFAALGNFWGTRGRHPGWGPYAIAVALIAFGLLG